MVQTITNPPAEKLHPAYLRLQKNKLTDLSYIMVRYGVSSEIKNSRGNMDYDKNTEKLRRSYHQANRSLRRHIKECFLERYKWVEFNSILDKYVPYSFERIGNNRNKKRNKTTEETLILKIAARLNGDPDQNEDLLLKSKEDVTDYFNKLSLADDVDDNLNSLNNDDAQLPAEGGEEAATTVDEHNPNEDAPLVLDCHANGVDDDGDDDGDGQQQQQQQQQQHQQQLLDPRYFLWLEDADIDAEEYNYTSAIDGQRSLSSATMEVMVRDSVGKENSKAFQNSGTKSTQKVHSMGCKCNKSECLKKYCECFNAGVICEIKCKCTDCLNYAGSQGLIDKRRTIKDLRISDERWKSRSGSSVRKAPPAAPPPPASAHRPPPIPSPVGGMHHYHPHDHHHPNSQYMMHPSPPPPPQGGHSFFRHLPPRHYMGDDGGNGKRSLSSATVEVMVRGRARVDTVEEENAQKRSQPYNRIGCHDNDKEEGDDEEIVMWNSIFEDDDTDEEINNNKNNNNNNNDNDCKSNVQEEIEEEEEELEEEESKKASNQNHWNRNGQLLLDDSSDGRNGSTTTNTITSTSTSITITNKITNYFTVINNSNGNSSNNNKGNASTSTNPIDKSSSSSGNNNTYTGLSSLLKGYGTLSNDDDAEKENINNNDDDAAIKIIGSQTTKNDYLRIAADFSEKAAVLRSTTEDDDDEFSITGTKREKRDVWMYYYLRLARNAREKAAAILLLKEQKDWSNKIDQMPPLSQDTSTDDEISNTSTDDDRNEKIRREEASKLLSKAILLERSRDLDDINEWKRLDEEAANLLLNGQREKNVEEVDESSDTSTDDGEMYISCSERERNARIRRQEASNLISEASRERSRRKSKRLDEEAANLLLNKPRKKKNKNEWMNNQKRDAAIQMAVCNSICAPKFTFLFPPIPEMEADRSRYAQEHAQDDAAVLKDIVPPTLDNIYTDSDSGNDFYRSNSSNCRCRDYSDRCRCRDRAKRNSKDPNRRRIEANIRAAWKKAQQQQQNNTATSTSSRRSSSSSDEVIVMWNSIFENDNTDEEINSNNTSNTSKNNDDYKSDSNNQNQNSQRSSSSSAVDEFETRRPVTRRIHNEEIMMMNNDNTTSNSYTSNEDSYPLDDALPSSQANQNQNPQRSSSSSAVNEFETGRPLTRRIHNEEIMMMNNDKTTSNSYTSNEDSYPLDDALPSSQANGIATGVLGGDNTSEETGDSSSSSSSEINDESDSNSDDEDRLQQLGLHKFNIEPLKKKKEEKKKKQPSIGSLQQDAPLTMLAATMMAARTMNRSHSNNKYNDDFKSDSNNQNQDQNSRRSSSSSAVDEGGDDPCEDGDSGNADYDADNEDYDADTDTDNDADNHASKSKTEKNKIQYTAKQNKRWDEMFRRLVAYKKKNKSTITGRCKADPELGRWVSRQRGNRNSKEDPLSEERIRSLNSIGFVWVIDRAKTYVSEYNSTTTSSNNNSNSSKSNDNIVATSAAPNTATAATNTTIDDFWKMTVKELQSECRKREISYYGLRKYLLIEKLQSTMD